MILELKTFNSIYLFLTQKLTICIYFAPRLEYKTFFLKRDSTLEKLMF